MHSRKLLSDLMPYEELTTDEHLARLGGANSIAKFHLAASMTIFNEI